MEGSKDSLRDLSFDGKPSGYREFRRKLILGVASLEDKQRHLAGPRVLAKLSGEVWKATEHLSVAEIRSVDGWIKVVNTLDKHYKYLPETELHEAIDEFLFGLKRRNGEGATAFTSRFRTALSRLENLISQERALVKKKKNSGKTVDEQLAQAQTQGQSSSSLEESGDEEIPIRAPDETDETEGEKRVAP